MRNWTLFFLVAPLFSLACTSAPREPEEIVPCPDNVAPAENGPWRLVRENWFTYCVPMSWDRSGRNQWSWGAGELVWDGGAGRRLRARRREVGSAPPPPPRQTREVIGGEVVDILIFENPGSYSALAHWSQPRTLYLQGIGRTPAALELVREVFRTVRFTAP